MLDWSLTLRTCSDTPTTGAQNNSSTPALPHRASVGHGRLALRLRLSHRRCRGHRYRGGRTRWSDLASGVGFDINCGVRFMALDATLNDIPNLKKLAGRLAGRIPAGGSGKGGVDINQQDLGELLQRGAHAAVDLGYGLHEDLKQLESQGLLSTEEANVSQRARERGLRSLGTLGSGNHFLELQTVGQVVDEATAKAWGLYEDQVVAMIHSATGPAIKSARTTCVSWRLLTN